MHKSGSDNWNGLFTQLNFISRLTSIWRSRQTYSLLKDIRILSFLELGAGTGYCAQYLYKRSGAAVSLLDKDRNLIKNLKIRYPHFQIINNDLFKFRSNRKWDLVYSLGVIEHFSPHLRLNAIQVHRNLSAKYVLIAVPKKSFIQEHLLSILYNRYLDPFKLYTPKELFVEIRKAKLKILKVKIDPISITVLAQKITP